MLRGEAAYISFNVFGLILPGLEPTTYAPTPRGEHTNDYIIEEFFRQRGYFVFVFISLRTVT